MGEKYIRTSLLFEHLIDGESTQSNQTRSDCIKLH